jgi:hypothetical protein
VENYRQLLERKTHSGAKHGFQPSFVPAQLFDFQSALVDWATWKGRAGIFADCGLGKTAMQLTWAENVVRKTNGNVLVLSPLAVSSQTVAEGEKFNIECARSSDGTAPKKITITNYERIDRFDANNFVGVVCDESSILKSYDGTRRGQITDFMRKVPYRLLATATAAPNDYIELGTSSEALGYLGHMDMLNMFFRNDQNNSATRRMYGEAPKWRFKGHGKIPFWKWVTSWARACRKPSDIGFDDGKFVLPDLIETQRLVTANSRPSGMLFDFPAHGLKEQRDERKRTVAERCERVAELINTHDEPSIAWCHLNSEGDLLEELIPGSIQISGDDSDDAKEEKFAAFISGEARKLITKPKIGAWGLNFQHCAHITYFPSHSYESYYQAVRRCWRFGQRKPVKVDIVLTEGDKMVMANLAKKSASADAMFAALVAEMNNAEAINRIDNFKQSERMPAWLA